LGSYRLYIDESGDHTFQLADNDNHRYLGLLGIWFDTDVPYKTFAQALSELKRDIFDWHPDDPTICLHRKDLIDRKGIFRQLRNPHLNARFERELITLVREANFCMTCVVIDKAAHLASTYRDPAHPYHNCLAALLERYAGWLDGQACMGDVMAESRGAREDRELRTAFEATLQEGTKLHDCHHLQRLLTSREIKLKKKEHAIAGLELSDLLAYPFKRKIVAARRGERLPQDFSTALLDIAREKVHCDPSTGGTAGYGEVWLD
jgi:hypothetical protein